MPMYALARCGGNGREKVNTEHTGGNMSINTSVNRARTKPVLNEASISRTWQRLMNACMFIPDPALPGLNRVTWFSAGAGV